MEPTGFPNNRWGGDPGNLIFRHSVKTLLSCGYTALSIVLLKQGRAFVTGVASGMGGGFFMGAFELSGEKARINLRIRKVDSDEVAGVTGKITFVIYQLFVTGVWSALNFGLSNVSSRVWPGINGFLIAAPLTTRLVSSAMVAVRPQDTVDHFAHSTEMPPLEPASPFFLRRMEVWVPEVVESPGDGGV